MKKSRALVRRRAATYWENPNRSSSAKSKGNVRSCGGQSKFLLHLTAQAFHSPDAKNPDKNRNLFFSLSPSPALTSFLRKYLLPIVFRWVFFFPLFILKSHPVCLLGRPTKLQRLHELEFQFKCPRNKLIDKISMH